LECRHNRLFERGLDLLAAVPADVEPIRTAQLAGQFLEGLHRSDEAFEAFSRMNHLASETVGDWRAHAANYRDVVAAERRIASAAGAGFLPHAPSAASPSPPVFLVGFPRSGTTLLDTILMGHPRVRVLEEKPVLLGIEQTIGGAAGLAGLDDRAIAALRDRYFADAGQFAELSDDAVLIDKSPLHMNRIPLIYRLFPEARIVLALRHPLDVVLSCFITSFNLNSAMANFVELESCAALYDLSFGYFEEIRSTLALKVHEIRYERVVADLETELRPLFDFLGLELAEAELDHRRAASRRGIVSTASYAQVREPIYERASGRWVRYRKHLANVSEMLEPWIERFGYGTPTDAADAGGSRLRARHDSKERS
jgi:hypothetical protein